MPRVQSIQKTESQGAEINIMRIGINALFRGKPTGVPNYICHLVNQLSAAPDDNEYVVFTTPQNEQYLPRNAAHVQQVHCAAGSDNPAYRRLWEQFALPKLINSYNLDVLHCPMNVLPMKSSCPAVVTMLDMQYFVNPQHFTFLRKTYLKYAMRATQRRADGIIAISNAVKREIEYYLGKNGGEIRVVHFGVSQKFRPIDDQDLIEAMKKKYGINGNYIMFPGYPHVRKNLPRLVKAFSKVVADLHENCTFVIAGELGKFETDERNIRQAISDKGIYGKVIFAGYVPSDTTETEGVPDMVLMMNGAQVMAYPSLYEGFGLPVIEAMACGTPVLSSDIPVMREVCGEAAEYVDPFDVDDIAKGLHNILTDQSRREALMIAGPQRAATFTWEKNARETLDFYYEVVGANK
jgi:glycosyltransferase involved in cell wall biosynthesis